MAGWARRAEKSWGWGREDWGGGSGAVVVGCGVEGVVGGGAVEVSWEGLWDLKQVIEQYGSWQVGHLYFGGCCSQTPQRALILVEIFDCSRRRYSQNVIGAQLENLSWPIRY